MTDTSSGTPSQADAHPHPEPQSRHDVADSTAFTKVFGHTRPMQRAHELPADILNDVAGRSPLIVQLLHNRGVSGANGIAAFLSGNWRAIGPALLHLDRAVERIRQAIGRNERIVVFGDFDCDGITSCALLTLALRGLGANARPYIPRRDDDGRGLNIEAVQELAQDGTKLIVTTDCGTANVAEVERASALGLDVIITDHHPPHGPLAPAYAVLNPHQDGDTSAEKDLAGVGVAFRVAESLLAGSSAGATSLAELLDLVAIGTIADVAPLSPSNWALTRAGLDQIRLSPRAGVRALLTMARLRSSEIGARDISFGIAPRINACGRMGNPLLAIDLLLATDSHSADRLAREVEALNIQRQTVTEQVIVAAREQAAIQLETSAGIVVAQGHNWPLGVLGLVAGRLADEYHRPAFVISHDGMESRGSARGPVGVNLGDVLAVRADFFKRFGGHAQAAGFTLPSEVFPEFLTYLESCFPLNTTPVTEARGDDRQSIAPVQVDCRLALRRIGPDSDVYGDLEKMEPFGAGFAEPVFLCPGARIIGCRRSGVEGRTLRLRIAHGGMTREFVWSRRGEICEAVRSALSSLPSVDVAYTLRKYHRSASAESEWLPHIETLAAPLP
ncbi:MAG TPA: single-stranded-DNA-specific exonuclease RecJ [Ktedonobacterales bacterium]|nr:single-stranded-DNA-specific exonuclease RecJ [Ktedonobacterales bacterium]